MTTALATCDPFGRIIEFDQFIGADGLVYDLHSPPVRSVISDSDTGLPPLEYTTERAPQQHGVSLKDHFLKPRIVQMVVRQNASSRLDRWFSVGDIMDALKPNRTVGWTPGMSNTPPSAGVLRKYMPNGTYIDLAVMIAEGPAFAARADGVWDEWSFQETLRFVAHNPLYYGPSQSTVFTSPVTGVVFPTLFPITFGQLNTTANITYLGNWTEYPTITIAGPLSNLQVLDHTNGGVISLNGYSLLAGQTVTIALPYGNKSITLQDGTSLVQYLSDDSDIVTFHLDPDPLALGGVNQIQVIGAGVSGTSAVTISWRNRYITIQQL